MQNISEKNGNKHKWEFFERFKINKQVVQAGALYVIYIWCTEKTRTVNIDIDRFGILEQIINWTVGKRYYYNEEFDPGSGWTLATGLTHASRGAAWS